MFETFSTNAIQIIDDALQIARSLNKKLVGSEHLLLAMYKKKDTICHFLLDEKQITYDDILRVIHNLVIFRKSDSQSLTYTKKFQEIILYSETLAKDLGSKYVYDEHIFYVMLKEEDSIASIVLEKLGLDIEDLMIDIEEIFNFFEGTSEKENLEITPYPFLTNLSKTKKVHPFIKRSNYIEKIIYILSKKQKNNPLLIGNAGVGKTAISKIEKGERNLTEQMAKSICREYNVNYDFLTYGDGEMFDDLPQTVIDELCAQYNLSDSEKAIIEMYVSLPEDFRQVIKDKIIELLHKQGWTKTE